MRSYEIRASQIDSIFIQQLALSNDYTTAQIRKISMIASKAKYGNLDNFVAQTPEQRDSIFYSFLLGLKAIHDLGKPHRDLSVENILVTDYTADNGTVFTIAKIHDFAFYHLPTDETVGTVRYLSPRIHAQIKQENNEYWTSKIAHLDLAYTLYLGQGYGRTAGKLDHATLKGDIWAIGVILHMHYGKLKPSQMRKYLRRLSNSSYSELEAKVTHNTANFDERMLYIMINCLQFDPAQRWTIEQIIAHLPHQDLVQQLQELATNAKLKAQRQKQEHEKPLEAVLLEKLSLQDPEVLPPESPAVAPAPAAVLTVAAKVPTTQLAPVESVMSIYARYKGVKFRQGHLGFYQTAREQQLQFLDHFYQIAAKNPADNQAKSTLLAAMKLFKH